MIVGSNRDPANPSHLRKVFIERECAGEMQSLHKRQTRAIGKTPSLVAMGSKDFPCLFDIFGGQVDERARTPAPKRLAGANSRLQGEPCLEQSKQLIEDVVTVEDSFVFLLPVTSLADGFLLGA
jgi:hypothetical protein